MSCHLEGTFYLVHAAIETLPYHFAMLQVIQPEASGIVSPAIEGWDGPCPPGARGACQCTAARTQDVTRVHTQSYT